MPCRRATSRDTTVCSAPVSSTKSIGPLPLTFTRTVTFSPTIRIGTVHVRVPPTNSTGVRPLNDSRNRISARAHIALSLCSWFGRRLT